MMKLTPQLRKHSAFSDAVQQSVVALLLGVTVLFGNATAFGQDKAVVLRGGKLLTITHGVIENGAVVLQGGKITAVGPAASVNVPSGAQVVDTFTAVLYGVAMTGIGMLTLTGNNVAMDAFGPISDNAQGVAELAGESGGGLSGPRKDLGDQPYAQHR